ncbi:MAG: HU family DNA-binding protein [Rhodospirillaceae bacterium]
MIRLKAVIVAAVVILAVAAVAHRAQAANFKDADVVAAIQKSAGISNAQAKKALEAALNEIGKFLAMKQDVSLTDFGTFTVENRGGRQGTDAKTGKKITIGGKNTPKFKAAKKLYDNMN